MRRFVLSRSRFSASAVGSRSFSEDAAGKTNFTLNLPSPPSKLELERNPTIFGKIVRKELPAKVRYEDEHVLAFDDVNPVAPTHILVIPKSHYENIEALASCVDQKQKDDTTTSSTTTTTTDTADTTLEQNQRKWLIGHMFSIATKIVSEQENDTLGKNGFRTIFNNGEHGGQTVPHVHLHIIGGRPLRWPPG